jgi:hypothetical protein
MHSAATSLPDLLFMVPFAGGVAFLIYRIFRYGGLTAALLGAAINEDLGEVTCARTAGLDIYKTTIRVQALNGRDSLGKDVGISIVTKSAVSYRVAPVALSRENAHELIGLLQRAIKVAEEKQ